MHLGVSCSRSQCSALVLEALLAARCASPEQVSSQSDAMSCASLCSCPGQTLAAAIVDGFAQIYKAARATDA
eukprot:5757180-Pleurochrysis_carterae.AAC.4